jgi:hypothetical protein
MSLGPDVHDSLRHDGVRGSDLIDRSRADLQQPGVSDVHVV